MSTGFLSRSTVAGNGLDAAPFSGMERLSGPERGLSGRKCGLLGTTWEDVGFFDEVFEKYLIFKMLKKFSF